MVMRLFHIQCDGQGQDFMAKTGQILAVALILVAMLGFPGPGTSAEPTPPDFRVKEEAPLKAPLPLHVPGEIIVSFKPGISEDTIGELLAANRAAEKYRSQRGNFRVLTIPADQAVSRLVEIFDASPLVEYAEPNYYAHTKRGRPTTLVIHMQWHFDNPDYGGIEMESAWDIQPGGSPDIIVAVVDTGVAYEDRPAPDHWHISTYNAYGGSGASWWCGVSDACRHGLLFTANPTPLAMAMAGRSTSSTTLI
jgi:hypothetical protein